MMSIDYKSTILLPKTNFPMRGSLPQKEPEILAQWDKLDLYGRQRQEAKGRVKFVFVITNWFEENY